MPISSRIYVPVPILLYFVWVIWFQLLFYSRLTVKGQKPAYYAELVKISPAFKSCWLQTVTFIFHRVWIFGVSSVWNSLNTSVHERWTAETGNIPHNPDPKSQQTRVSNSLKMSRSVKAHSDDCESYRSGPLLSFMGHLISGVAPSSWCCPVITKQGRLRESPPDLWRIWDLCCWFWIVMWGNGIKLSSSVSCTVVL